MQVVSASVSQSHSWLSRTPPTRSHAQARANVPNNEDEDQGHHTTHPESRVVHGMRKREMQAKTKCEPPAVSHVYSRVTTLTANEMCDAPSPSRPSLYRVSELALHPSPPPTLPGRWKCFVERAHTKTDSKWFLVHDDCRSKQHANEEATFWGISFISGRSNRDFHVNASPLIHK